MRCLAANRHGVRCFYSARANELTCCWHPAAAARSEAAWLAARGGPIRKPGGGGGGRSAPVPVQVTEIGGPRGQQYDPDGCVALLCGVLVLALQDARQHKNEQRADRARRWLASAELEWLIERAPRSLNMTDGRLGLADATDPRSSAWTK